jgi:integrase
MDLSRKRERERLPVRREAYWQRLAAGAYVGFRRGPDTWLARYRGRDRKQQWQALGEGLDYDEAKQRAEDWIGQLAGAAVRSVKRATVKEALQAYLADLRRHGRSDAAKGAEWRFKKFVYNDALAGIELESATRDDFLEWRERHLPGRAPRTVQRQYRAVRAALNRAAELGHVGNPLAWKLKPLQDDVEDSGETAVYLDATQRRALIAAAEMAAGDFLRGMELSGARPIELAAAKVADFDGATLRLAHRKGKPPKLRVRHAVLGKDGIEFFGRQIKDRSPNAFLFTEDGERAWRSHTWAKKIRAAIGAHNKRVRGKARIPTTASAYSFRHARISELLQLHGVDPLTVAAQTGTSLVMIEKAYLRFIPSAMQEKLAAVKESA